MVHIVDGCKWQSGARPMWFTIILAKKGMLFCLLYTVSRVARFGQSTQVYILYLICVCPTITSWLGWALGDHTCILHTEAWMHRVQGTGLPTSITPIPTKMFVSLLCMYIRGYLGATPIPCVQGAILNLPKPYLSTTTLLDVGIGQGQTWVCQFSTDGRRLRQLQCALRSDYKESTCTTLQNQ